MTQPTEFTIESDKGKRNKGKVMAIKLKPTSWKIMLEVLVKANPTKVVEVPIQFKERQAGESKFSAKQIAPYVKHILLLALYKNRAPIKFGGIGLIGMAIHFILLYTLTEFAGLWYILSAIIAIIVASTNNYFLNHLWTFRDRAIGNHAVGWVKYQLVSGITDGLYLGLLAFFVEVLGLWYMLGAFVAVLIVFVLKFKIAANFIWKSKKRSIDDADSDWENYYNGHFIQRWWKRSIAETVWNFIPRGSSLLDIGCGSSPIIAQYPGATGIDINEGKVKFMREKLPTHKFRCLSVGALVFPWTFDDNAYDYVLCIEVLEHLKGAESAVKQIARVLKPGGKAVIATPDYSKLLWHIAEKFTAYKEEHITQFTKKSLEKLCREWKLEPIKHKYVAGCDLVELFEKRK